MTKQHDTDPFAALDRFMAEAAPPPMIDDARLTRLVNVTLANLPRPSTGGTSRSGGLGRWRDMLLRYAAPMALAGVAGMLVGLFALPAQETAPLVQLLPDSSYFNTRL